MCTLAVAFYPQTQLPLIIGANRDENPTRPAEPWRLRNGIYSPLDVRGGTWIGVNVWGIFCALTNWDLVQTKGQHGFKSRGDIVLSSLNKLTMDNVLDYWGDLNAKDYRPFNVIAGTKNSLYHLSCDNNEISIQKLGAGFHCSTGEGFDIHTKRSDYIYEWLSQKPLSNLAQPIHPSALSFVLSQHNAGIGSEDSVCVHDENHRWETRSSSLIVMQKSEWDIKYIDQPPCSVSMDDWIKERIDFQI